MRSPEDIQQLAVDVENASLILEQLGKMHEVNAQSLVIEIVHRFPGYAQLKWNKFALNYKDDKDAYPAFSDLVTFIAKLSRETTDPVYGVYFRNETNQSLSGSGHQALVTLNLSIQHRRTLITENRMLSQRALALCAINHIGYGIAHNSVR